MFTGRILVGACLALALTGCASTSTISTRYLDEAHGEPVRRLLVVARTPEAEVRKRWEERCARALASRGLDLVLSHKVMPLRYEAGNASLLEWGSRNELDGILIGELTALLMAPAQIPPEDFLRRDRGLDSVGTEQPVWQISSRGEERAPVTDHHIEFSLMRPNGEVLWDGATDTHEANDLEAIAGSQCRALGEHFRELGLVPQ